MVMQVSRYCIVFINALWGVFITNKSSKYVLFYKPQRILRSEYKVTIRLLDSILKQSFKFLGMQSGDAWLETTFFTSWPEKFVHYIAKKNAKNFTFT